MLGNSLAWKARLLVDRDFRMPERQLMIKQTGKSCEPLCEELCKGQTSHIRIHGTSAVAAALHLERSSNTIWSGSR
jgi:hypothetical protein